jgi:DNA (cytosine-5)-methyltransferase 1
MRNNNSSISVISLYSGAGGLDLAFESNPHFKTKICIELNPTYAQTLFQNKGKEYSPKIKFLEGTKIINSDVSTVSTKSLKKELPKEKFNSPLILIGGPPCQPFSTMGKRLGLEDVRGLTIFDYAQKVKEINPDYFVFENVPNLGQQWKGEILRKLIQHFEKSKYHTVSGVLNAADFGATTKRKRLVIIGTKLSNAAPSLPTPTHINGEHSQRTFEQMGRNWVGVKQALKDLPPTNCYHSEFPTNHVAVSHTKIVLDRFKKLKPGEQDKVRKRWKLDPELPSNSLMAGGEGGYVLHIHPHYPRELTLRECARIQGFPDTFEFHGKPLDIAKQIVNAVPIQFGRAIADHLFLLIAKNSKKLMK